MTPLVTHEDADAVHAQVMTSWIGRGEKVSILEGIMADWVGAKHAVALGSGSAALAMAVRTMGVFIRKPEGCCQAVIDAVAFGTWEPAAPSQGATISIYPQRGGDIEDFAKHLPRKHEITLEGKYGVFSFGALKDVSGGMGGCLVSNEPIDAGVWLKISPICDINASMILSQLSRYECHHEERLVSDGKVWRVK